MSNKVKSFMSVLSVLLMQLSFFPVQADSPISYRVSNIKAHLFHHENGKFSELDVINGKDISLFNTIIGEGTAGIPSGITLVLVEISGPNFHAVPGKLLVTATEGKATLAKQSVSLEVLFSENGKTVQVPVLIYNTGCKVVKIAATIQGQPGFAKSNTMLKEIPFGCGE